MCRSRQLACNTGLFCVETSAAAAGRGGSITAPAAAAMLQLLLLCRKHHVVRAAKELHFNKNMDALKKMQAGADKLATVVGVTLGPKVRRCLPPLH